MCWEYVMGFNCRQICQHINVTCLKGIHHLRYIRWEQGIHICIFEDKGFFVLGQGSIWALLIYVPIRRLLIQKGSQKHH